MKTVSDRELRNFWRLILEVSDDRLNLLKTIYYVGRSCADVWSIPPFLSRPTYLWRSKYTTKSWTRNSCWDDGWEIQFWKEMKIFRRWVCQFEPDGTDLRMNLMTLLGLTMYYRVSVFCFVAWNRTRRCDRICQKTWRFWNTRGEPSNETGQIHGWWVRRKS